MSAANSHTVLWDDVYDILLHVFSFLSVQDVKVARLVCRKWEDAALCTIKNAGRLYWQRILHDLSGGRVGLSTIEGRLVGFRKVMICPYESPREHHDNRVCIDRLDPNLKEFAFPFAEDNFIADAAIYISFIEKHNWIYNGTAIYFLDRFVEGVNQGKFQNLETISLKFLDTPISIGYRPESYPAFKFKEGSLPKVRKLKLSHNGQLEKEIYVASLVESLLAAAPNVTFLETDFPILRLETLKSLIQLRVHFAHQVVDAVSLKQSEFGCSLFSMFTGVEKGIKYLSLKGMVFENWFVLPVFPSVEGVSLEDVWLLKGNIETLFPSLKRLSVIVAGECDGTWEALSKYLIFRSLTSPLERLELGRADKEPNLRVEIWHRLPPIVLPTKTFIFWLLNDGDHIPNARKDESLRLLAELEHPKVIVKVWWDTRISSLVKRLQNLQLKENCCKEDGKAIEFHFASSTKRYGNGRWKRMQELEDDSQISKFRKVMKLLAKKWSSIKIKYFYITQRQFDVMTEGVAAKSLPVEIFCGVTSNYYRNIKYQGSFENGIIRKITSIFK